MDQVLRIFINIRNYSRSTQPTLLLVGVFRVVKLSLWSRHSVVATARLRRLLLRHHLLPRRLQCQRTALARTLIPTLKSLLKRRTCGSGGIGGGSGGSSATHPAFAESPLRRRDRRRLLQHAIPMLRAHHQR